MKLPTLYDEIPTDQRWKVREAYIERQKGLCYHCKCPLKEGPPERVKLPIDWSLFPEGFLKHPVHLHHSHDTGLTLGAVHAYCNAVLWEYHGE